MPDRVKLTIIEVKEPRPVGQTEVLEFLAHVGTDTKTARYGVWSRSLYEYVKKDAVIDCDVDTKVSEKRDPDGNPYISRKVTQIYVDGQPVTKPKGQFQPRNGSPEAKASIEAQVAVKAIIELRVADKIDDKSEIYKAALAWCKEKLAVKAISKSAPAPTESKTSPADQSASSNPSTEAPKKGVKSGNPTIPEFKTAVELFNFALSHGRSLEEIQAKTGYNSPANVVDLKAAVKALYP